MQGPKRDESISILSAEFQPATDDVPEPIQDFDLVMLSPNVIWRSFIKIENHTSK